jgi:hypothetical protein
LNTVSRNERSTVVADGEGDGAVPAAAGALGRDWSSLLTIASCACVDDVGVVAAGAVAVELELEGADEPQPAAITAQLITTATSILPGPNRREDEPALLARRGSPSNEDRAIACPDPTHRPKSDLFEKAKAMAPARRWRV